MVLAELKFFDAFGDVFVVKLKFGQNEVKQNPRFDHFEIKIVFRLLFKHLNLLLQEYHIVLTPYYLYQRQNVHFQHAPFFTPCQLYNIVPDNFLVREVVIFFIPYCVFLALAVDSSCDGGHSGSLEIFIPIECGKTTWLFFG